MINFRITDLLENLSEKIIQRQWFLLNYQSWRCIFSESNFKKVTMQSWLYPRKLAQISWSILFLSPCCYLKRVRRRCRGERKKECPGSVDLGLVNYPNVFHCWIISIQIQSKFSKAYPSLQMPLVFLKRKKEAKSMPSYTNITANYKLWIMVLSSFLSPTFFVCEGVIKIFSLYCSLHLTTVSQCGNL